MSRLQTRFDALKAADKTALVPFITAGDPHPSVTVNLMHDMVAAGASVLELGVPFSDPMAEGPVIQLACERALKHNVSLADVLQMVKEFRVKDADTPIVLMGYTNPVEVMGYEKFASAAGDAGVDGLILVDLPPEEGADLISQLKINEIDMIFLLAPTTTDERMELICKQASGFVYYVSLKGVTGSANLDVDSVVEKVSQIRTHTSIPVGVGFGIRDAQSAAQVAAVSDAVVVGSAIVNRVAENADDPKKISQQVCELLSSMRTAMDK
ncbi:MAG: tryptophan synthase subunit alpha [endosymbiont of Galathealinum brachiosum]|uniref:Tryptophan synthase alpha chain n=1 Tax=endosymbiont of Galathealinum brachiosum TaxID=2200906 RepID=A0A370DL06_9GAMM|nr:MAG: tryptophan synthase subunit alpha [endosymbiont of Galathealinum brachiosum]